MASDTRSVAVRWSFIKSSTLLININIICVFVELQAESRCTEKLQAANGYYNMLLEEFGHVVGHEEAQNIHTLV